jgi:hypothetical protein
MKKLLELCTVVVLLSTVMAAKGDVIPDGIAFYKQGAVTLSNPGDYDWWYGCSPTSAGMIMGHYDVSGYNGQFYDNLVPGGQAEDNTYGSGPYLANNAIASSGHISDFYGGGDGASLDDVAPPWHSFNCLADFMGTSQDSCGNSNGATTFYVWINGVPFTASDAVTYGVANLDGMYGIGEYLEYAGYDAEVLYSQLIPGVADWLWPGTGTPTNTSGFTFAQYMAEIDAGRPVIIQVEGHSMYGYGYDSANNTNTVLFHDTWTLGQHSMTWGGSYSGMQQWGVVALTPIPEPTTICLLGLGALSLLSKKKINNQKTKGKLRNTLRAP